MIAKYQSEHWSDKDGNPAGGVSTGTGVCISWQNGPLGRGEDRREPNGAFVETVLSMVKDRIDFYQATKFASKENSEALHHIGEAMRWLDSRTKDREARDVEGTHAV